MTVEGEQPTRRISPLRLLAAALAGGIGAFGVPAAVHPASPPQVATAPPPVSASDATLN